MEVKKRPFRLISWNVANRKSVKKQVQFLLARPRIDIVAIQEVVANKVDLWRELLQDGGFCHSVHNLKGPQTNRKGPRKYGQLIASRWELKHIKSADLGRGWHERLLSTVAIIPHRKPIEIHSAHVPHGSGHGEQKLHTLNGIYRRLARHSSRPRILCGDFNTPKEELRGHVFTFGQTIRKNGSITFTGAWGKEWDLGERNILENLGTRFGLLDIYRLLHPQKRGDQSWYSRTKVGRRFDHIFASGLRPISCQYLHDCRKSKLSDHSAIKAVFR